MSEQEKTALYWQAQHDLLRARCSNLEWRITLIKIGLAELHDANDLPPWRIIARRIRRETIAKIMPFLKKPLFQTR